MDWTIDDGDDPGGYVAQAPFEPHLHGVDMVSYQIKQGDLSPPIRAVLRTVPASTLEDVTLVEFAFKLRGDPNPPTVQQARIVDRKASLVAYDWQPGDTDAAGQYLVEWRVHRSSGVSTFPNDGFASFTIVPDLAHTGGPPIIPGPVLITGAPGLVWMGVYSNTVTYTVNAAVEFPEGVSGKFSSFRSAATQQGVPPLDNTGALNPTWERVAQRGADGAQMQITPDTTVPISPLIAPPSPTVTSVPPLLQSGTIKPPSDGASSSLAQIAAASAPMGLVIIDIKTGNGTGFGPGFQLTGPGLAAYQGAAGYVNVVLPGNATRQQVAQALVTAIHNELGTLFPGGTWDIDATLQQDASGYYVALSGGSGNHIIGDNLGPASTPFQYTGMGGAGGTSRAYSLVVEDVHGNFTDASMQGSATGAASLDVSHAMHLTWVDPAGTSKIHIFRRSGGALDTLGYIGVVNAGAQAFDDIGQAGDGSPVPNVNNTGNGQPVSVIGLFKFSVYVRDFVGTWHAEVFANNNWFRASADQTNAGFADVEVLGDLLRIVITALTGTPPTAFYRGLRFNE